MLACALLGVALLVASEAHAAGTVGVSVTGKGDVTGSGIDCDETDGPDCSEFYANELGEPECNDDIPPICFTPMVPPTRELTAAADRNGYQFNSFTGCDSVNGRVCSVTVDEDKSITARFDDVTNPTVGSLQPNGGIHSGTVNLSATASDNSGDIDRVEFFVRGVPVSSDTTAPYSLSFNTASVPDGSASLYVRAVDGSDRIGSATTSFTIDNLAPNLTVNSGPDDETFGPQSSQSWAFTANDTVGLASVRCSVAAEGETPVFSTCSGGNSHTVSDLPHGDYTFSVRATDDANHTTTVSRSFSIDAMAPETTIASGPGNGSTQTADSVSFGFASSEPGATFECRLFPAGITGPAFGPCSTAGSHSARGLSPGNYTFEVRATDALGNRDETAATRTFTVSTAAPPTGDTPDRDPPTTLVLEGPKPVVKTKKKKAKARFVFEADEPGSSFRCSLDGGSFAACNSPLTIKVKKGKHSMRVRATDAAGNAEPGAAEWAWKVKKKKKRKR